MQIVLYQPQIPQNTGNIVRTCSATGSSLVLVPPLGFSINDRWLKRASLDYWGEVDVKVEEDLEKFLSNTKQQFYFFSSKAKKLYTDFHYEKDAILIFGSETKGLPMHFHLDWEERFAKVPMLPNTRCLNLATCVGVVLYEACRQTDWFTS